MTESNNMLFIRYLILKMTGTNHIYEYQCQNLNRNIQKKKNLLQQNIEKKRKPYDQQQKIEKQLIKPYNQFDF